jgi:4-amino-4-deoxy-L-arabinose transferase-like glycosyltransferase
VSDRRYLIGLAGLAAVYLGLAAWLPPADDELYYVCWARELELSYFDHPPMTAYLIRVSTAALGESLFAARLPASLTSIAVLAVIGWLTRPRQLLFWIALTPLFTFGAVLITPDTPLLLFWSAYLAWLVVVHRRLSASGIVPAWLWAVGGLLLGGGALGKYTAALAVPAGFVSFTLSGRDWKEWFPGYVFHGGVSFLVALPVLVFNVEQDFAPLKYQWEHATATDGGGLRPFGEFVAVQVVLFGLLPLLLFPWVVWNIRSLAADPRLRVCACLYAVPFGFFLYKAVRGPLEGNWALACYVGFWPLAGHWFDSVKGSAGWRWFTAGTFAVPAGAVGLLAAHLVWPVGLLPPEQDRVSRQAEKAEIARLAAETVRRHGEHLPVYTPSYQWTAFLRYHGVDARQIDGATRPSHFTLGPDRMEEYDRVYVFSEGPLWPHWAPEFGHPEVVATFPLVVRGETITHYQLLVYTRSGPTDRDDWRDGVAGRGVTARAAAP